MRKALHYVIVGLLFAYVMLSVSLTLFYGAPPSFYELLLTVWLMTVLDQADKQADHIEELNDCVDHQGALVYHLTCELKRKPKP